MYHESTQKRVMVMDGFQNGDLGAVQSANNSIAMA